MARETVAKLRPVLVAAVLLTVLRGATEWRTVSLSFHDFQVFLDAVSRAREGGALYGTGRPDYFDPGTPVYKYPPPYAALLEPFVSWPRERAERLFLAGSLLVLAGALATMVSIFKPTGERRVLAVLAFANWEPLFESLQGLQVEPLLLLLVALALAFLVRGRLFGAGVALGAACAFKIYPGLFVLPYLARRRWAVVWGAASGLLLTLLTASLAFPVRISFDYFTRILPRLGGVELAWDSIGLWSHAGRLALLLHSGSGRALAAGRSASTILGQSGGPGLVALACFLSAVAAAPLVLTLPRALARAGGLLPIRGECATLGLTLCVSLLLLPTSWPDYQTLLALPAVWAVSTVSSEERGLLALVVAAVSIASLPAQGRFLDENRGLICSLRSLLPLLLGAYCWARLLRPPPPQGTTDALASSS